MGAGHTPGRLEEARPPLGVSLAKGARRLRAVLAPVVGDIEANMATVPRRMGMAGPYGALWPCLFRDSGVVGCTVATLHPIAIMWVQS